MDAKTHIVVGKFLRPHGIDGRIKLASYTDPVDSIASYTPWLLESGRVIKPHSLKPTDKFFIVELEGITSREHATQLTNSLIYIPQDQLPPLPEGRYYWHQLHGLEVYNLQSNLLGTVDYLTEGAQYPLIVVKRPGKVDILIPYTDKIVTQVNLTSNTMIVNWLNPDTL
ncbi:MAG: ribosome maturation factor RimM [Pseudomonadota bacterium]|nr:ribosome maturation factor RimM [Pseudomonadota bacterium]